MSCSLPLLIGRTQHFSVADFNYRSLIAFPLLVYEAFLSWCPLGYFKVKAAYQVLAEMLW